MVRSARTGRLLRARASTGVWSGGCGGSPGPIGSCCWGSCCSWSPPRWSAWRRPCSSARSSTAPSPPGIVVSSTSSPGSSSLPPSPRLLWPWLSGGCHHESVRVSIFDLRVALFDHVQRLPIGFFTRTQTGALTSRMNNDVIGAQRAVTGTLGSVVSNVVVVIANLAAIVALDWRFAVLTIVLLPLFIVPARRVGRKLQAITREQMDLNSSMNTTMTERFNVAGALLVKLFGRADEETADFARRADRCPVHRRAFSGLRTHVLRRTRPGRRARRRPRVLDRRVAGHRRQHDRGNACRPGDLRHPHLPPSHGVGQRPGRHHDGVRLLRPRVRGARCAEPAGRSARCRRPRRPARTHRDR